MNTHFQFQYPWVLALLALLPLYVYWRLRPGKMAAIRFPSSDLLRRAGIAAQSASGRLLLSLRALVVALVIVALAGPRLAHDRTETQASGVDIMLVVDLSWSMMALDMSGPNERVTRFDIAKSVLEEFIQRRETDRIGMIVFSGVPYLASPLTLNHDWLIRNLRRLNIGIIRELGTAIGDATATAVKRLQALKDSKSRIIIVLTDGDNNKGEIEPIPAAELAAATGARLYTIGIGREEPCHLPSFDPATGKLLLDAQQRVVPTIVLQPANYSVLDRMSGLARGKSYRAVNRQGLREIYRDIDRLEKTQVRLRRYTTYTPLFQWPLGAALMLFLAEQALASTRYRRIP